MDWNWQLPDWPNFRYDSERLEYGEGLFREESGTIAGATKHLRDDERDELKIELISLEAVGTAAIEGEHLDRASVQSSLRQQLGLSSTGPSGRPAETGMAEMMLDLYDNSDIRLSHQELFEWHRMIMRDRQDIRDLGQYRSHPDPMQIVSGPIHDRTVHFEAPPSSTVKPEMDQFLDWFNATGPGRGGALPSVTRAGIAHLYFESIHPFEDGNGRIGRAISEKALAQGSSQPVFTALAETIQIRGQDYYRMLAQSNKRMDVTDWLLWFSATVIEARRRTIARIDFVIEKTRFLDRLRGQLNDRQEKVLLRMLREGPEGFTGGLSAGNYMTIAKTSTATTTRDLRDLVEKEALVRVGERKHARYNLAIASQPVTPVTSDDIDGYKQ